MNYPTLPRVNNDWNTPDPNFWEKLFETLFLAFLMFVAIATILNWTPGCARAEVVDMKIIAQIESSNNPLAYNRHSQAVGLYQITPICLNDYNLTHKTCYELTDLLSPKFNYAVAYWYLNFRIPQMLKAHKLPVTLETTLWAYNAGVGRVLRGEKPKETKNYILKYKRLSNANS